MGSIYKISSLFSLNVDCRALKLFKTRFFFNFIKTVVLHKYRNTTTYYFFGAFIGGSTHIGLQPSIVSMGDYKSDCIVMEARSLISRGRRIIGLTV